VRKAALTVPDPGLDAATLPTVLSVQVTLVVKDAHNPSLAGVTNLSRVTLDNVVTDDGGDS
jgi:hypothetical protein